MQKSVIIEEELGIPGDYQYKALTSKNPFHSNWHANKLYVIEQLYLKNHPEYQVLDLGMGAGIFEISFSHKVKHITGIDRFKAAVDFVSDFMRKKGILNVEAHHKPLEDLKHSTFPHKFDLLIILDVIEHLDPKLLDEILQNIKEHLADNAKVIVTTPNYKSGWVLLEKLLDLTKVVPTLDGAQHVTKFDKKQLIKVFEKNGYKLNKCCTFNTFSFLVPNKELAKKAAMLETRLSGDYGNLLLASFSSY